MTRSRKRSRKRTRKRTRKRMKGGAYKEAIIGTLDGLEVKSLKNMTVSIPGIGVLSGYDYIQFMKNK